MRKIFPFLIPLSLFAGDGFVYDKNFFDLTLEDEKDLALNNHLKRDGVSSNFSYSEPKFVSIVEEERPQVIDGVEKVFYPSGKLKSEIAYRNGQKDGMEKLFYPDGKTRSEICYKHGIKDGVERIFYPDGKLKSERFYRAGIKSGMEKIFYPDGKIKSETFYRDGKKSGVEKLFAEDGRFIGERRW
jgi:antitoxin component YwqK of YwqJK toxin-antitoxin module